MLSMYAKKKKKIVSDVPRPTLLGHEKEMKTWREQFGSLAKTNTEQAFQINFLKRKINRLQSQIDALESIVKRIR